MNIPIVYEDDWLLIVNKPAGLLIIPAPYKAVKDFSEGAPKNAQRTLTSILNEDLQQKGAAFHLHPCHRLDRETSGLIIYAKGKSCQKKMMEEFRLKQINKSYIAFVQGSLPADEGQIRNHIEGKSAVTRYRVIEKRKDFSIVEVEPLTGRTNQIRIHFKSIGHPLVGETKFAFRKDYALRAKRACLHARALSFKHPVTGKSAHVESELAEDLKKFLIEHPR